MVVGGCATVLGERRGDWNSIAVSARWLCVKAGGLGNVLVGPYGIFEILMGANHAQMKPRPKLRIGPTGKTGSRATLNITTQTIGGIVGERSTEEATQAMANIGAIDIPNPTYGYLRGIQLVRDRIDDLCRQVRGKQKREGIYVPGRRLFFRYHMKYTMGVIEQGEVWGGNYPNFR